MVGAVCRRIDIGRQREMRPTLHFRSDDLLVMSDFVRIDLTVGVGIHKGKEAIGVGLHFVGG